MHFGILEHGNFIRGADFSLCDGVGVIIAGWFWGVWPRRFNGPILQLECSARRLAERVEALLLRW